MVMTLLLFCGPFILTSAIAFAQQWKFEEPDYKSIEHDISDERSPFYYSELLTRYVDGDSTLSLEERRHVYYGYTFQPAYSPYARSHYADSLRNVFDQPRLTENDYALILRFTDSLLQFNPFDLRAINYKLMCHDKLGNRDEFHRNVTKMRMIVDAIMSSGNGVDENNAFYVINTSDEYDLLGILGFQFGGEQRLIKHYDYLKLKKNDAGIEGMYFDVSPCLNHLNTMFGK
jgi:hypothetical protein